MLFSRLNTARQDFQALGDLLSSLGLEESFAKSCSHSSIMTCIGVELNTDTLLFP